MITLDDIRSLIVEGESETLELKKSTGQRTEACRTLCAMANAKGGKVIFGVTPDSKSVVGQEVSEKTLHNLSEEFRKFEPPIFPKVERISLVGSKELISVSVSRATRPPCTYDGKPYQRILNTTVQMPREIYQRLLLESMHGVDRWENSVATDWSVDMLGGFNDQVQQK